MPRAEPITALARLRFRVELQQHLSPVAALCAGPFLHFVEIV